MLKLILLAVSISAALMAQVAITLTATIPNDVALSSHRYRAANGTPNAAQVSGNVGVGATTITTLDATLIPPTGMTFPLDVLIDDEAIRLCSKTVNVLNVCTTGAGRGAYGTTAATHASTTAIHVMLHQTPVDFLKSILRTFFRENILGSHPTATINTQLTAIATAEANIAAAKQGAVQ